MTIEEEIESTEEFQTVKACIESLEGEHEFADLYEELQGAMRIMQDHESDWVLGVLQGQAEEADYESSIPPRE